KPPPQMNANFDVNFTEIGAFQASASDVVVQQGDTLRSIATRLFGDGNLWYLLADENGLTQPDAALQPGTNLRVPNQVYSLANTAGIFKPFDPNSGLDSKQATLLDPTPPPPKQPCGGHAKLILTVIAVVVTIIVAYFMGPASGPVAAFFQGMIAAVAGNAVSQGVAIGMGMQEGFNWKSAALAGVSGGLGGVIAPAVGQFLPNSPIAAGFVSGAIGSALTQGAGIALGLQKSFSWKDVAMGAVSGAANAAIAKYAPSSFNEPKTFLGDFGKSLVTGTTSSVVQAAFGGKIDGIGIVTDAFGTALGNSIVRGLQGPPKPVAAEADEDAGFTEKEYQQLIAELESRDRPEDPFGLYDPDMLFAGNDPMAPSPTMDPRGTKLYSPEDFDQFRKNLKWTYGALESSSARLAEMREERGWLGKAWDAGWWDTDYEEQVAAQETKVGNYVKDVVRYGAILELSEQSPYIPNRLADENYFHANVVIDTQSSLLSNATEIKNFIKDFKERYDGVKGVVTNVRRTTGILKLFTQNKPIGGLATFINLFAKGLEDGLDKFGKRISPITKVIDKGEKIYKIGKQAKTEVLDPLVAPPLTPERQAALEEVDMIGSSRGYGTVVQFGRAIGGASNMGDQAAVEYYKRYNPKTWVTDLIDASQEDIEVIEAPN
ncbi:MAG TPA: LysM domain-containing protein, partial [Sphingomicrobium sp.]|nr:LysM domain-containing protein [Sphingomicrobium sp.]